MVYNFPTWWRIACLLIGLADWSGTVRAESAMSIDSLKNKIRDLVQEKEYSKVAASYEQLGGLYHQRYGYNRYTVSSYASSLKYYSLAGDSLGYYHNILIIGDYYTRDYFLRPYAQKYIQKARQFFERTHNIPRVIECRLAYANIAQKQDTAYYDLIVQLREIERLSAQYKQPFSQAYALNLLANTYSQAKQPDSTDYFASKSLVIARQLNVNWLIAQNYFYLGIVQQFRNHPKEAIEFYQKSYKIAKAENNLPMLRELSRHVADSYSRLDDYKNAYKTSLNTLDFAVQFYTSEQTKSILLQELDSQMKMLAIEKELVEQQRHAQNILNSTLAVGLIICVIGILTLIFLRRQQKLIDHQHTVIAQQQIRQLELKSLRAMIEGQEGERSRIARDLHDGLGIQLSRIKLFIEAHQELLPVSVKNTLNQFLDEACAETRLVSNNLRPYALSTFGLIPALEDLVQKLNLVNQTKLILESYGEVPPLGDEASVMIYRVVQELLNNALKHAQAQSITVQIMASPETTLISVDDDGTGNDFVDTPSPGNGIANIKSRIAYLGGQVIWHSEMDKGTSVMISLPMVKLRKNAPVAV